MASPTAIPHPEASAHHLPATPPPNNPSSSFSRSPTGTSPNPIVSPIYTSAGRSAFSLPGPNSSSTSPTTTSWYSAGFASNNSQRVRSPTSNFTSTTTTNSSVIPQRDYFETTNTSGHFRKPSFGSNSRSSSISSADLMNEPTTPKPLDGVPLGRVPSIPMGSSFDQIKGHRGSWGPNSNSGWNGLNNFRASNNGVNVPSQAVDNGSAGGPGMGGIFRKFSFGNGTAPYKSKATAPSIPSSAPPQASTMEGNVVEAVDVSTRGRQASVGAGSIPKRRPSPMGERLLMGHFNLH